jgi:hypothetical protein
VLTAVGARFTVPARSSICGGGKTFVSLTHSFNG